MGYTELNSLHKRKMGALCGNQEHFEWEDTNLITLLKGNLPELRNISNNAEVTKLFIKLKKEYDNYYFFGTNTQKFISNIKKVIEEIREIEPYWFGISIESVEDAMNLHKGCLISGEGGIGKSYFVKCLEDELTSIGKKHLCLYGKWCQSVKDIDFDEIVSVAETEEFVFVFDAINEIDKQNQIDLLDALRRVKDTKGLRIIVTYRTHMMEKAILKGYCDVLDTTVEFAGVSFESVLEWLQKSPVVDINEYLDVLYSNNPFILKKLPKILDGIQDSDKNNVSRYTYIYEQFIKKGISKETWEDTKKVAKLLYQTNKKTFTVEEVGQVIDSPIEYIATMEKEGFINRYGEERFSFVIESLADYLIVRNMWDEISGKPIDECSKIIKNKIEEFYSLSIETVILMLFDKFPLNYVTIKKILEKTNLLSEFNFDILLKIHFNKEDIPAFLECFKAVRTEELIITFAGYLNKPFNCMNYLNEYYLSNSEKQTRELSKVLSGEHYLANLKGRLKNILYFTCKCDYDESRAEENLYTSIWCSAACDSDVRNLATKIMFEIVQESPELIKNIISIYEKIEDDYIKDTIIFVLSSCTKTAETEEFFDKVLKNPKFLLAKSIRRISSYLGEPHSYINLNKQNMYSVGHKEVSESFEHILFSIDIMDKDLLPFRFRSRKSVELHRPFLLTPKQTIHKLNKELEQKFPCVKDGYCNGSMVLERNIEKAKLVPIEKDVIDHTTFLSSMEQVFRETFSKYGVPFDEDKFRRSYDRGFSTSILKKCTCISIDIFFGSLMCNYYIDEFATYSNINNSIGYEIYDPIEYEEELNIKSPLPIFQPQIEKMCNKLTTKVSIPEQKDEKWWRDLDITKENILNILKPFKYKGEWWVVLACRISLQDPNKNYIWKDTYDLFACSSTKETLKNDGNERYLTIEIPKYNGNLLEYNNCAEQPWKCKSVSSIAYASNVFDDTHLILPPAEIISTLNLSLNLKEMRWENKDKEGIIYCNNNKASYYNDPVVGAVFIKKDAYEKFVKTKPIKYFVYADRLIENKGYCSETSFHFEIINGEIVKEYPNYKSEQTPYIEKVPQKCKECKYGFYSEKEIAEAREKFLKIIEEYSG